MKRISIKGIFYIALAAVVFFPIIAVLSVMDYHEKIIRKKIDMIITADDNIALPLFCL